MLFQFVMSGFNFVDKIVGNKMPSDAHPNQIENILAILDQRVPRYTTERRGTPSRTPGRTTLAKDMIEKLLNDDYIGFLHLDVEATAFAVPESREEGWFSSSVRQEMHDSIHAYPGYCENSYEDFLRAFQQELRRSFKLKEVIDENFVVTDYSSKFARLCFDRCRQLYAIKSGAVFVGFANTVAGVINATAYRQGSAGWHWVLEIRESYRGPTSFFSWSPGHGNQENTDLEYKEMPYKDAYHESFELEQESYLGRTSKTDSEIKEIAMMWARKGNWSLGGGRNCGDFMMWMKERICTDCQSDPRHKLESLSRMSTILNKT